MTDDGRRCGGPSLFEPGQIVDGDPGQLGELFPAQPGRTASSALGDSDRRWSDTVTPVTHGRAELSGIHSLTVHPAAVVVVALAVLRQPDCCLTLRGWPTLGAVDSCCQLKEKDV
jgi:hypothetical protein